MRGLKIKNVIELYSCFVPFINEFNLIKNFSLRQSKLNLSRKVLRDFDNYLTLYW